MTELGDVLELLHRRRRWNTLRAEGYEWRHTERTLQAFDREHVADTTHTQTPTSTSSSVRLTATYEFEQPPETHETWRLWLQEPDRVRTEFIVGDETVTAAIEGDRWWSWSPSQGGLTNEGDPRSSHGLGPAEELIDTARILPYVDLAVADRITIAGRDGYVVRATPRAGDTFDASFALHALGSGADEYELVVDAERGVLLRAEARLDREPFRVTEVTEAAFDEAFPPETFTISLPEGETFRTHERPRHLSLDEAATAVRFTVLVPEHPPSDYVHVTLVPPLRGNGHPLTLTIIYPINLGDEYANLWITECAEPLPDLPEETWHKREDLHVGEDRSPDHVRSRVQLEKQGTYVKLETTALPLEELVALARSMVPLPPD